MGTVPACETVVAQRGLSPISPPLFTGTRIYTTRPVLIVSAGAGSCITVSRQTVSRFNIVFISGSEVQNHTFMAMLAASTATTIQKPFFIPFPLLRQFLLVLFQQIHLFIGRQGTALHRITKRTCQFPTCGVAANKHSCEEKCYCDDDGHRYQNCCCHNSFLLNSTLLVYASIPFLCWNQLT